MNPTDYYELQLQIIGVLNANFEFWLGATFAVIVAFHFAANTINAGILRITIFLYVGASILFGYRWLNAISAYMHFDQTLVSAGEQPYPTIPGAAWVIAGTTTLVMLIGTISTVVYAYLCYKKSERPTSDQTPQTTRR